MEKIGANANIKVIGITGHVSSGKSTLLGALQNMGVSTLSVDTIIHNLYNTNEELIDKIIGLLGDDILTNNKIDNSKIAKKVFTNRSLLTQLEKLTLPYVLEYINYTAKSCKKYLAIEIPLLFELSLQKLFDITIFVKTKPSLCEQRSTLIDFALRNNRLFSSEKKEEKADITITNNGTIAEFNNSIQRSMEGIIA